jgi:hypothetical protein
MGSMPRRKNDCELDLTNQILSWKNIQGYVITRKFFTIFEPRKLPASAGGGIGSIIKINKFLVK